MSRLTVPFEVRKERSARAHPLIATGELDVATVAILERAFDAVHHDDDAAKIVVELGALSFMDSTGVGVLVRMNEVCDDGERLRIVNGSPAAGRALDLTGVRRQLPTLSSDDEPLAPVARGA